jgi:transposase
MLDNLLNVNVLLYRKAIDMRKSIDGLSIVISSELDQNPSNGAIYVFCNKSLDKVKVLYWDRNGFCLLYKRLEKQKFILPKITENVLNLAPEQFRWLLDGLDINQLKGFKKLNYNQHH